MKLFLPTTRTSRSGFTLIEVIISLSMFVVLLAVLMGALFQLTKSQRDANEIRKVVADLRTLVSFVQDEMRTKTVDFCGYRDAKITPSRTQKICDIDGESRHQLVLVDKNSTEQTIITFNPTNKKLDNDSKDSQVVFMRKVLDSTGSWISAPGFISDAQPISTPHVQLKDVSFSVTPVGDPNTHLENSAYQMQPSVTMRVTFGNNYFLQTTFSSRVY